MDLLSQRYANPYVILDDFIRIGQLHEFSCEILKLIADERIQNTRWEYYLHKVFDMSYEEYLNAFETKPKMSEMTDQQKKDIINKSNNMLDEFNM